MEPIRRWAMTLCICCALAGLMRILLPEKSGGKGIKIVLALYVLLSVCTGPPKADWSSLWQTLCEAPRIECPPLWDPDSLLEEQFCRELERKICTELHQNGVEATVSANAVIERTEGMANLTGLQIALDDPGQRSSAEKVLVDYMGTEIPVEWSVKGDAP